MSQADQFELPPAQSVRKANGHEMDRVAQILGSAFTNDPLITWMTETAGLAEAFYTMEVHTTYRHHNHVYINDSQTGAAMWLPPGVKPAQGLHWRSVVFGWQLLSLAGFAGAGRGRHIEAAMEASHPSEPHYYLHAIGAHLDHQGEGIGSALLKTGLADVDAAHMPAYLESSNVRNNPLYERYGFEIMSEQTLPDGGPSFWPMWRDAQ